MGAEVLRTQIANYNADCQHRELSWFEQTLVAKYADFLRFVQDLFRSRLGFDSLRDNLNHGLAEALRWAKVHWYGVKLYRPDWRDDSRSLAVTLRSTRSDGLLHLIIIAYWQPLDLRLPSMIPALRNHRRRLIDTSLRSLSDIIGPRNRTPVESPAYLVHPRSLVMLSAESTVRLRAEARGRLV
jgi:isoamylase